MPMYEYACQSCGHHFELLVRERTRLACPTCDSEQLAKQLSVFAVSAPSSRASMASAAAPCGSCGHPDGPGSCRVH